MAKSKKSKQRKIAAKRGKKKAKRKQVLARQKRSASVAGLAGASTYPLYQTLLPGELSETGMGIAVFSRRLPDSRIAVGTFLVDVFCLGVKDAMARIMAEWEYEDYIDGVEENHSLKAIDIVFVIISAFLFEQAKPGRALQAALDSGKLLLSAEVVTELKERGGE